MAGKNKGFSSSPPGRSRKFYLALADQMLVSGANFFLSVFLARSLPPEDFGLYVLAFTVMVSFSGFVNSLVGEPMAVLGASMNPQQWKSLLPNCLLFGVAVIGAFSSILLVIDAMLDLGAGRSGLLPLLSLVAGIHVLYELARRAMLARANVRELLLSDAMVYGARLALIAALFVRLGASHREVVFLYGFSAVSGLFLFLWFEGIHPLRLHAMLAPVELKKIWHLGRWTGVEWIPFFLSGQMYVFLVALILGDRANGILASCNNLIAPITVLLMGVSAYVVPYYSKQIHIMPQLEVAKDIKKFFKIFFALVLFYCLIMCYFSYQILMLLYPQYATYHKLTYILSIGILFNILFKPFDIIFRITKNQKFIFYARCITGTLTFINGIILIKYLAIQGAALTYVISQAAMFVCLYIMARGQGSVERVTQRCATTVD